ncbi:MAG: YtxH domain-containing protein [Bacillota bacterium]
MARSSWIKGFVTGGIFGAVAGMLMSPQLQPRAKKALEQTGEAVEAVREMAHKRLFKKRRRRWF